MNRGIEKSSFFFFDTKTKYPHRTRLATTLLLALYAKRMWLWPQKQQTYFMQKDHCRFIPVGVSVYMLGCGDAYACVFYVGWLVG